MGSNCCPQVPEEEDRSGCAQQQQALGGPWGGAASSSSSPVAGPHLVSTHPATLLGTAAVSNCHASAPSLHLLQSQLSAKPQEFRTPVTRCRQCSAPQLQQQQPQQAGSHGAGTESGQGGAGAAGWRPRGQYAPQPPGVCHAAPALLPADADGPGDTGGQRTGGASCLMPAPPPPHPPTPATPTPDPLPCRTQEDLAIIISNTKRRPRKSSPPAGRDLDRGQ